MAAGRTKSAATSPGLRPSFLNHKASLAAVVVLPVPCIPANRISVGGAGANLNLVAFLSLGVKS